MPNIKSAKKRVLVISKKTLRNQMIKSAIHTALKKADAAILAGDKEAATAAVTYAVKKMDQAAAKESCSCKAFRQNGVSSLIKINLVSFPLYDL